MDEIDDVDALTRVETGERLVEHEHRGVVHDRLRDLDPLPHALRVGREASRVVGVEFDEREGPGRRAGRVFAVVEDGRELHELECSLDIEERLLLRYQPELPGQTAIPARVVAEDANRALRRRRQPAEDANQCRLAGAVGPQQGGDPGADGEGDVGDGDEVAEPFGHVIDRDHGRGRRRRWLRRRWLRWGRWRWRCDRRHRVTWILR